MKINKKKTSKRNKRFSADRNSDVLVYFESVGFIQMTAYLADICCRSSNALQ